MEKKIKELQSLRFYIIFPCNLHYGPAIPLLSNYLKEINMKDPLKDLDNNVYMKPQTENNQRLSIGWQTSNGGIAELRIATAAKLQNEKCLLSTCTRMWTPRKPASGDHETEGKQPGGDPGPLCTSDCVLYLVYEQLTFM